MFDLKETDQLDVNGIQTHALAHAMHESLYSCRHKQKCSQILHTNESRTCWQLLEAIDCWSWMFDLKETDQLDVNGIQTHAHAHAHESLYSCRHKQKCRQ